MSYKTIAVRIHKEELKVIDEAARIDQRTRSSLIRYATVKMSEQIITGERNAK